MEKIPFTSVGLEKLKEELSFLKSKERPSVINAIAEAREHGDLSENAEYHAAREKQGFIEGRIQEIEDAISRSEVIDILKLKGNKVTFGTSVTVADEETDEEKVFHIVGPYEADLTTNKISTSSPISKGLIGKSVGDVAQINTPGGIRSYELVDISIIDLTII